MHLTDFNIFGKCLAATTSEKAFILLGFVQNLRFPPLRVLQQCGFGLK